MPDASEMPFSTAFHSLTPREMASCYADARKSVRAVRNAYQFARNMSLKDAEEYLHDAWAKLMSGLSADGEPQLFNFQDDVQIRVRRLLTRQAVFFILQDIPVRGGEIAAYSEYLDEDEHDAPREEHAEATVPIVERAKEKVRDHHMASSESDHDAAARLAIDLLVARLGQRRTKIRGHAVELIKVVRSECEEYLDLTKDRKVTLRRFTIPPQKLAAKLGVSENYVTKIKSFIRDEAKRLGYEALYSFFVAMDAEIEAVAKDDASAPTSGEKSENEAQSTPASRRVSGEKK